MSYTEFKKDITDLGLSSDGLYSVDVILSNNSLDKAVGIYAWYLDDKVKYIGQSIDIKQRLERHVTIANGLVNYNALKQAGGDVKKTIIESRRLYAGILKHGIKNFKIKILDYFGHQDDFDISLAEIRTNFLNEAEMDEIETNQTFIARYPKNGGYNLDEGGNNPPLQQKWLSEEDADLVRKLAVDCNLTSTTKINNFIDTLAEIFSVSSNRQDGLIALIIHNSKKHSSTNYFISEEEVKIPRFSENEIAYFKKCNNSWMKKNAYNSDGKSTTKYKNIVGISIETGEIKYVFDDVDDLTHSLAKKGAWKKIWHLIEDGYYDAGYRTDGSKKLLRSYLKCTWTADKVGEDMRESHGNYGNDLDITKALENKDECIRLISDNYGYNGPIETGGFYIMPDGTAIKSINHADIDKFLIRNKYIIGKVEDYGDGSQFMDAINCVRLRRRGGKDSWILPYMILPENQLTQAQYNIVSTWVDFVMSASGSLSVQTMTGECKNYHSSGNPQDIMADIRSYYRFHFFEGYESIYEPEIDSTDYRLKKDLENGFYDQF